MRRGGRASLQLARPQHSQTCSPTAAHASVYTLVLCCVYEKVGMLQSATERATDSTGGGGARASVTIPWLSRSFSCGVYVCVFARARGCSHMHQLLDHKIL